MNSRMIKAILVAPLSVFPVWIVVAFSVGWIALLIGLIAVVFAYIGMLVIGIPSMLLLRRYQTTRWWQLTLAGAVGPACLGWLSGAELISPGILSNGVFGALVAGAAWFIAFRPSKKKHVDLK